jgi:peroxiredoxin
MLNRRIIFLLLMVAGSIAQAATPLVKATIIAEADRPVAPAFEIENLHGGNASLADYKGKLVLLNFWATWCVPCTKEMPGMQTLWKEYKEQGLEIVAISVDEGARGRVETFSKMFGINFPILLDPESKVSDLYEVSGVPISFLIDRNGRMITRIVGTEDWLSDDTVSLVQELLAQ